MIIVALCGTNTEIGQQNNREREFRINVCYMTKTRETCDKQTKQWPIIDTASVPLPVIRACRAADIYNMTWEATIDPSILHVYMALIDADR